MHSVGSQLQGNFALGDNGQHGKIPGRFLQEGGGQGGELVRLFRGQNGRALQASGLGHDQIVACLQPHELTLLRHAGHHASAGDGAGHSVSELRMAAQNVHVRHLGRGRQIIGDPADPFGGIVGGKQQRHQQAHRFRPHADGVVAVYMDAQKSQTLFASGGDGVHAKHDQVAVKVQRSTILAHPRHRQGLGADPLEF